jgi:uncharacterized protein YxeA
MPQDYDNTNSFVLFPDRDRKTDRHPTHTGTLNVDGVEYFMDAWVNESKKDGTKFQAGKIKRKDKQSGGQQRQDPQAPLEDDDISDIPF